VALEAGEVDLVAGDLLAVVTDGVTEASVPGATSSATSACVGFWPNREDAGRRHALGPRGAVDAWWGPRVARTISPP